MDSFSPRSHSARDAVYLQLRERILSLELPPGTALSEKDMSIAFQVSRTPVRESFVRLAQEGLVQVLPQRGTFVSLIDTEHALEARFMREQLERAVVRLACDSFPAESLAALEANLAEQLSSLEARDDKRMFDHDEAFHRAIFEGCRKLNTWAVLQQMKTHLNRARLLTLARDRDWEHLYRQHLAITDAIRRQDAERADAVMRDHLNLAVTDLQELKRKHPDYFK